MSYLKRKWFCYLEKGTGPARFIKALHTCSSAKNALKEKKVLVGITIEINKNE